MCICSLLLCLCLLRFSGQRSARVKDVVVSVRAKSLNPGVQGVYWSHLYSHWRHWSELDEHCGGLCGLFLPG